MCKEPIKINPTKLNPEHMQIIGNCGTYGHKQIVKEMFMEESRRDKK